ncbi:Stk1 family PASTA domain-containing Ser/Thr kinase [Bacillus sp. 1NLA3E]|uniref:Stk1 family PASTA domain-containing Ser/Thr kinase n=1 Tax=Bacillus sp. 1NLA3E TaxID=666686 RepID=UPI000247E765|nr:Stk1 family PASTA domain-containing Ser/Thr kinase [Bacillus sp. 1NLA3E]AGK53033.1 serine/threonine protein kinase with PASTA sensor(s) [Bacillus sp. 1NLA3E]
MMIGKRVSGRYKIIDMVGGGGMANVYLAHDMILDRDVAVKMLRLDFANDEEFIRRFHREAQSATSLVHPNIVSIYDVGEEKDLYYIVMEYVEGQTLKQYIQTNSPLAVEETIDIMKQLTSAISHAHQNNIVHRDIKPHNILVDNMGNVKITDFGIAMALSATSITQTNSVLGSVHYLSPEQARGGMANKKSDIYSLGIVMFELLTGRLPFSGESAVSIALKHLQSETPSVRRWNPLIPQSVENIVLKATAKDPFHRYNSVDEMEEDLRSSLDLERINEPKFVIPLDNDATKAIPIITNDRVNQNLDHTLVHDKDKPFDDQQQTKKGKQKKKRKKWPIILVTSFVSLVLIALFTVFILPDLMAPKDVEVPDVSGLKLEEALSELRTAGFKIGDTIDISSDEVENGYVIRTDPKAGKTAKEGLKVDVYQSTGKETYQLSDYTDRQYDDVVRLLEKQNFKDITKTEVYDESDPGTILKQSPEADEEVIPEETVLEFTVSKGVEKIKLKDLTEYNTKSAQDYADSVGLTIDMTKEEYNDTIGKGLIISQIPAAGTELTKGDKVSVVISKGKEEIPPKTVTKTISIPYQPSTPGQANNVQVYIEDVDNSMTEPFETMIISQTVTKPYQLRIAYGGVGAIRVIRDKSVIIDEKIEYPTD